MSKYRSENDSLGEVHIPADAFWGAHTQRTVQNFRISGLSPYPAFIWSMAAIKRAAAEVNADLGFFQDQLTNKQTTSGDAIAQAIMVAADEVIEGKWNKHFVVDPIQAGAGISHNINANEVIANLANRYLGFEITASDKPVHPHEHVNMAQSISDMIPTAIRLGCLWRLDELLQTLGDLAAALRAKAQDYDAPEADNTTLHLEQALNAHALSLERNMDKISQAAEGLRRLGIGGSTSTLDSHIPAEYHSRMVATLSRISGLTLYESDNFFESRQSMADPLHFSSSLRTLAQDITRIATDLRSTAAQSGSAKADQSTNSPSAEILITAMYQVMGNDLTILLAGQAGQLELNALTPLIAHNLFQNMDIIISAIHVFTEKGL